MDQAHLHLLMNHFPVIIPILGLIILLAGFILRSEIVKRTAFGLFILGALFTFPVAETGEGAEEIVEKIQGIENKIIHNHEESADTFIIISYILGLISIIALWANWKQKSFSKLVSYVVILLCGITIFYAQKTSRSGGEIRHTEIRNSSLFQSAPQNTESGEENNE